MSDKPNGQHKILFVFSKPPYGSERAREGLDAALSFAAFDFNVSILFIEQGVWQLSSQQMPPGEHLRNHFKALSACPMYDIDKLYVYHPDNILLNGLLTDNPLDCKKLDKTAVQSLLDSHNNIQVY